MTLLINIPNRNVDKLVHGLSEQLGRETVQVWPDVDEPDKVTMALVWHHEHGSLTRFNHLKAISSFGAGVDGILADTHLPNVPIARIVDDNLSEQMCQYVHGILLHHQLRLSTHFANQVLMTWKPRRQRVLNTMGILGLGELGTAVATYLRSLKYNVIGWSKSAKQIENVESTTGESGLNFTLSQADCVICLLPLTQETHELLNDKAFAAMKPDAILINVARGKHVKDDDLISALNNEQIAHAYLDVFQQEPLPSEHPFWHHEKISMTPHVSAVTDMKTVIEQIVDNYKRVEQECPMRNTIDRDKGY
ncbi:2-hydroxyacid dehydrogenase [Flocculibacter collagenilyticus]|uniref:2-hydroxyacid dehydrogenase n=1 Tax=Flocculibacter collagenilyticus TaxID=2744479 RepID=UPI0018F748C7|nr:glyoxylate/hydroxypyruvate reductase A [Flocculibacter collagenilyticus]